MLERRDHFTHTREYGRQPSRWLAWGPLLRLAGQMQISGTSELVASSPTALEGLNCIVTLFLKMKWSWMWLKHRMKVIKTPCYHTTNNCRINICWEVIVRQILLKVEKTSLAINTVIDWLHPPKEGKSTPHPKVMVFLLKMDILKSPVSGPPAQKSWIRLMAGLACFLKFPGAVTVPPGHHTLDSLLAQPASCLRGSQFRGPKRARTPNKLTGPSVSVLALNPAVC